MRASPVGQPPSARHSSSNSGPAARWIAPSTPPPPSSDVLAALTIASTLERGDVGVPGRRVGRAWVGCSGFATRQASGPRRGGTAGPRRAAKCRSIRMATPVSRTPPAAPAPAGSPEGGAPPSAKPAKQPDRRLRLDDILKLMVADGLVSCRRTPNMSRARARSAFEHPLENDRRRRTGSREAAAQAADARAARRVARGQARGPVPPHRSAEDRPGRRDRRRCPTRTPSATASCRWRSTA